MPNTSDKEKKKKKEKKKTVTSGHAEHERQQLSNTSDKLIAKRYWETKRRHERHMGEKDGAVDAVSTRKEASTYRMFQSCPNPDFQLRPALF